MLLKDTGSAYIVKGGKGVNPVLGRGGDFIK